MASKDQYAWNKGMTGAPRAPKRIERPGKCAEARCGTKAGPKEAPTGMRRIQVAGSAEPARLYCEGHCARYGKALAELRAM